MPRHQQYRVRAPVHSAVRRRAPGERDLEKDRGAERRPGGRRVPEDHQDSDRERCRERRKSDHQCESALFVSPSLPAPWDQFNKIIGRYHQNALKCMFSKYHRRVLMAFI